MAKIVLENVLLIKLLEHWKQHLSLAESDIKPMLKNEAVTSKTTLFGNDIECIEVFSELEYVQNDIDDFINLLKDDK